jgi:lipopolysaccharide export system permease protein
VTTLWRYISSRFLRSFLGSLVILALVVLIVDMLLNLDEILETKDTVWGAIQMLFMRTASLYLPYLIPFATFSGAFLSLGLAARSREVLAMKAGGISPLRAVLPIFLWAVVISVGALILYETVTVPASSSLNERLGVRTGEIYLRSGTIWYHTGRFIYNIRNPDPEKETVQDIRVFERDGSGRLVRLIRAKEARREAPGVWDFHDATVRSFDPATPDAPPSVRHSPEVTLELAEERSPRLLRAELATLPIWTLLRHVMSVRADGEVAPGAELLLSERLSSPLLVILFALLAVPLSLRVEQTHSVALPAVEAALVLFLFMTAREYVPRFATLGSVAAPLAPWLVLSVFFAFGGLASPAQSVDSGRSGPLPSLPRLSSRKNPESGGSTMVVPSPNVLRYASRLRRKS